jgi:ABC-type sugar transport system ATPase subunit
MSAIRFSAVSKRFPGVTALAGVSFDVMSGSCHAICGENGAGKSTLGKILAGIERADDGTIEIGGRSVEFRSPRDAMEAGVAIVHQELAFCPNLSVAENLCLSSLPARHGVVDRGELRNRALEMLAEVGAEIDPGREMAELTIAEQQLVQIASAVGAKARVIIFDEPTSSLGQRETENLFDLIDSLRERGTTLIYVSHRMPEIFRLCYHVTVLRDGKHVVTRATAALTEASLVEMMIGRSIDKFYPAHTAAARGAPVLEAKGVSSGERVRDVSFTLHAGEVLGVAGLVGAGRSELAQAIFGLEPMTAGSITIRGKAVVVRSPDDAMVHGMGFVPEDRKRLGLVLSMLNRENGSLAILDQLTAKGLVNHARENSVVGDAFVRVRCSASHETATSTLSGGNQQKVVLAKWLAARSDILILDEPTRGVDIGAKAELHTWIDKHVAGGGAVLLISSEMPELLNLSSRVLVLREGKVAGELSRAEATQENVLRMMLG